MPISKVQKIVDELIKSDALEAFIEESTIRVEKIMSEDVISLDYSKTVVDAAAPDGTKRSWKHNCNKGEW